MLYKDLNPTLDSDLLEKAGFNFDGYYYVNPLCPLRFNKAEEGYSVSFIDPSGPQISEVANTYCDLIALMVQSLNAVIEKSCEGQTFTTGKDQLSYIATVIKDYFDFDKRTNFVVINSSMGLQVRPNNEYTYTIVSGDIRQVKVYYEIFHKDVVDESEALESKDLTLEISIQCISWPFLMSVIADEQEEFNAENDKITINKVVLIDEDKEVPFFGMGIPKIHKKNDQQ